MYVQAIEGETGRVVAATLFSADDPAAWLGGAELVLYDIASGQEHRRSPATIGAPSVVTGGWQVLLSSTLPAELEAAVYAARFEAQDLGAVPRLYLPPDDALLVRVMRIPMGAAPIASTVRGTIYVDLEAHGFPVGSVLKTDGAGGWLLAQADSEQNLGRGVVTAAPTADRFALTFGRGAIRVPAHGLGAAGDRLYTSQATPGALVSTAPPSGWRQYWAEVLSADVLLFEPFTELE